MSVAITYKLTGHGWAECTIAIGDHHASVTASYLSDAWADLLSATARVVSGEPEAAAAFAEEPGEYRWGLIRRQSDRLRVRILKFPHLWSNRPDDEGKVIFEADCRLRTFGGAVLSASQRLLDEVGGAAYHQQWGNNPFPFDRHERLRLTLAETLR